MYVDEGNAIMFTRKSVAYMEDAKPARNPFKSYHLYAAMIMAPLTLVLNRVFTPIVGDGNGVFIVVGFLSIPMMQWGMGLFVQTAMLMVYYPIKLQRETGKPVLMKDW
ncbi:MAG TPA: hypothetical protein DCW29_22580 [Janthinobacterium sp.]|nr:hypothetical protein [Janthinobacterium sp.]